MKVSCSEIESMCKWRKVERRQAELEKVQEFTCVEAQLCRTVTNVKVKGLKWRRAELH